MRILMTLKYFVVAVLVLACAMAAFSGCSTSQGNSDTTLTVATFNLEWLGDGDGDLKARTDKDYLSIADIIVKTEADVLGVQEIENDAALNKVLRYLQGYKGFVLDGGTKQNVGVVFKERVSVELAGAYWPLVLEERGRLRPGMMLRCRKGSFDWLMMVVHLKSTSRYDSTAELRDRARVMRTAQSGLLQVWADSVISAGVERDVMIVGDFNDYPGNRKLPTLSTLTDDSNLRFLTERVKSCRSPTYSTIDHILVSSDVASRFIKETDRTENFRAFLPPDAANRVSDHCPVMVRLRL